jgi:hypothetical protein
MVGLTRILLLLLFLSFAGQAQQTSGEVRDKKQAPHGSASTGTSTDSWLKMKECAAQAEKVKLERDRKNAGQGFATASDWVNHYSPKYNRCFAVATFVMGQDGYLKHEFATMRNLVDAFEGTSIATAASVAPSPAFACRNEEKPKECERVIKDTIAALCLIDGDSVDCGKAEEFIKDHMKN